MNEELLLELYELRGVLSQHSNTDLLKLIFRIEARIECLIDDIKEGKYDG